MFHYKVLKPSPICLLLSVLMTFLPTASVLAQSSPTAPPVSADRDSVRMAPGIYARSNIRHVSHASSDDVWMLEERSPDQPAVAAATFYLHRTLPLPKPLLAQALGVQSKGMKIQKVAQEIAIGAQVDANGIESYVAALRVDTSINDEDGQAHHESIFAPILIGKDMVSLETRASELANAMNAELAMRSGTPFDLEKLDDVSTVEERPANKSVCQVYCQMDLDDAMANCQDEHNARDLAAASGAAACGAVCLALAAPPLVAVCLGLCLVAQAAAVASSLNTLEVCQRNAGTAFRNCTRNCPPPDH